MAAWIVCALCALIIIKPQEFIPALAGVPVVYVAFGTALLAIVRDIIWKRVRPVLAPQTWIVAAFLLWALLVTAVKRPHGLPDVAISLGILTCVYAAVAVGLSSPRGLFAFGAMFIGCALLVTLVAIVQNYRPYGCFLGAADDYEGKGELSYDGRPCESILDCRKDAPVPDGNYRCEHVGPLNTSSIGGRVRYRGSLADPNELSLMLSASLPFVLALAEGLGKRHQRKASGGLSEKLVFLPHLISDRFLRRLGTFLRSIPASIVVAAVGFTIILSKSRSGLIVYLTVLGVYLVRRVGAWGIVAGCLVAPPMILLGGRSGTEAEESSDERAELLREALEFIRNTKGIGLGVGQFTQESSIGLTAHNAYVLAAAEAGLFGLLLFGALVYMSVKVPYAIWFGGYRLRPATLKMAATLAIALSGTVIGIFFLSWTYKDLLYMQIGASAALYAVAKAEDPTMRIGLSGREAVLLVIGLFSMLAAVYIGVRIHK